MPTETTAPVADQIEFASAVMNVMHRHRELEACIMAGHRDLAQKGRHSDPAASALYLAVALSGIGRNGPTLGQHPAMLDLLRATLHVWWKIPAYLTRLIVKEMQDRAILRNENPMMANIMVDRITSGARGEPEAMDEKLAALKAKAAAKERERDARYKDALRNRRGGGVISGA